MTKEAIDSIVEAIVSLLRQRLSGPSEARSEATMPSGKEREK